MDLLVLISYLILFIGNIQCRTEIIVERPFYLRARIHDGQSASVQFEIARENDQRSCHRYKFTIRRNREYPYSMPEQNLTFWRNTLELKHLSAGQYRICAIICSEYLTRSFVPIHEIFRRKNHSIPIETCVHIRAYQSHFLILTLYILVFVILAFSQIIYTLRKRKIRATIKSAIVELENTLQKRRANQTNHSYTILQSLLANPALPLTDQSITSLNPPSIDEHHPISFHLDLPSESLSTSEIP